MKRISLIGMLVGSLAVTSCAFQNGRTLPTAPDNAGGNTGGSSSGGGNSTNSGNTGSSGTPASAFAGNWGSSTIAGLPLGNCSDVKWLITEQSASSVGGSVTATCANGITVAANLTGTLANANTINLVANGTFTAAGVPCQFNLTGVGTRQTNDSMNVDYNGSYCLGTLSGSETLRKFPNL
jgi:hypothetical protein